MWMAWNGRLATKDRLLKVGIQTEAKCAFCREVETLQHLMFECVATKNIWREVMAWMQIQRVPEQWHRELEWIAVKTKGKGWRAKMFRIAIIESVYAIWIARKGKGLKLTLSMLSLIDVGLINNLGHMLDASSLLRPLFKLMDMLLL